MQIERRACGVGCMVNSCGTCENCLADREQNCLKEATFTYNSPDPATGGQTFGGYSDKIVVPEHFLSVFRQASILRRQRQCYALASRPSR
jgi:D-arabinose 1-dehydrogenase-like Zn-dependent alcohol dehydrogenase